MKRTLFLGSLAVLLLNAMARAQAPLLINHQGRVGVGGVPFNGSGQFKFALVNAGASETYWRSAADTSPADGQPDAAVTLAVSRGVYSVMLGDTSLMLALDPSMLSHPEVRLRVWFSDGLHGFELLAPDQRLGSAPYALVAQSVSGGPVVLGDPSNPSPAAGTIRWNGSGFQGYNGAAWEALSLDPRAVTPMPNMAWIRPGSFAIGSPDFEADHASDESPQTAVSITRGFWMGIHEVTQGEYLAVAGGNPSEFIGDTNRPVEKVTWIDATNYCALLTVQERAAGRLPATWGYRLPTEAEWEYAARAGTATAFSHGDDPGYVNLDKYAWYDANGGSSTHAVGSRAPNAWGLFDMYGNVWEWCLDLYGPAYPGGGVTDPRGPGTGSGRVIRGGSWLNGAIYCRSAYRYDFVAENGGSHVGFRVVLSADPP